AQDVPLGELRRTQVGHHSFPSLPMRNSRDEIHQSFFAVPGRVQIAAQQLGAQGVSDDSGSAARLLLDLRRKAKETGDGRVLVRRPVVEQSEILAAPCSS